MTAAAKDGSDGIDIGLLGTEADPGFLIADILYRKGYIYPLTVRA